MVDLDELMGKLTIYTIKKDNGKLVELEINKYMLIHEPDEDSYVIKVFVDD